jgi:hypothetical protein
MNNNLLSFLVWVGRMTELHVLERLILRAEDSACGPRIGADLFVGDPDEFRDLRLVATRNRNLEIDREIEIPGLPAADADVGDDGGVPKRCFSFRRHAQKSVLATGSIAPQSRAGRSSPPAAKAVGWGVVSPVPAQDRHTLCTTGRPSEYFEFRGLCALGASLRTIDHPKRRPVVYRRSRQLPFGF